MSYESLLRDISKIIKKDVSTLKRVGPAPRGLSKFEYIAEVLPSIDNFAITDKADGTRSIVVIESGIAKCIKGSDYFEFAVDSTPDGIYDCELLESGTFLIFDTISSALVSKPFKERHLQFKDIKFQSTDGKYRGVAKKFTYLTTASYQREIMSLYSDMKKYEYNTDGIIFTQIDQPYMKTRHNKWKPTEHLTIDFFYIDGSLYSGISRRSFKQLGLKFPDKYMHNLRNYIRNNGDILISEFFPIPFMPSIAPLAYKFPINGVDSKEHGNIIELSFDIKKNEWIYHRTRTDRIVELKDGHYFGNNFEVAELTFESIMNPLTITDLVKSSVELSKGFYFEKSDDRYKEVRKYNSFVKGKLIKRASYAGKIIDMASGKGQDLMRYMDAKVKNLLMLEIDQSAIDEIITRKFEFSRKMWIEGIDRPINVARYEPDATNLTVMQADLTDPAKDNNGRIEKLNKFFVPKMIDFIICNMALHYLVGSDTNIKNVAQFISHWLRPGGEFIFTSMDASKIKKILVNGSWVSTNGIYRIESGKKDHIKVLLPCSTTLREEPLVNLAALDNEFKKIGLIRVTTNGFDKHFEEYDKPIDDTAKEFAALYHYCIYKMCVSQ